MAIIRVLKPFVFTYPPLAGERMPTEESFKTLGDVVIADDHPLLKHPWFVKDHCDGRVESPAQAQARVEQERLALEEQEKQNVLSKAAAEAAVARLQNVGRAVQGTAAELDEELNTPIPLLRARQNAKRAAAIDAPGGVAGVKEA